MSLRRIPLSRALLAAALSLSAATAVAAPAVYEIDPAHTYPSFEADHMGISVWRGKFDRSSGEITFDRTAQTGSVNVVIDTTSIDYGLGAMNDEARKETLLDTAKFPTATYTGTLTDFRDGAPTRVKGELTLHGVTKPVDLAIKRFKCMPHPLNKRELCGADAYGDFQRDAFGIDAGKDYGFDMTVSLRIQVEATQKP
jgi:polyisoprenoid-binding protein YceI